MALVEEHSNVTVHDDGHEDLLEELLIVLDRGTVNLKQWFVQLLGEGFGEFCFAQALCSIEHKEGSNLGCLVRLKIEGQLFLNMILANE